MCLCSWHSPSMTSWSLQTCLFQNTSVSTPKSLSPYFRFLTGFFWGCTTNQSKQNSVKGQCFCHSSCKNSVSTHIFNYIDSLHFDDFILFTSAKVVLHQRPQNTFSKNNAPCLLLSLMPTRPFLNICSLVASLATNSHSFTSRFPYFLETLCL